MTGHGFDFPQHGRNVAQWHFTHSHARRLPSGRKNHTVKPVEHDFPLNQGQRRRPGHERNPFLALQRPDQRFDKEAVINLTVCRQPQRPLVADAQTWFGLHRFVR